jgi:hypothetical protein
MMLLDDAAFDDVEVLPELKKKFNICFAIIIILFWFLVELYVKPTGHMATLQLYW